MADIFSTADARKLLRNKFVLLLGDSNMRATYKDLILLINRNELLSLGGLRKRGEDSFEGDRRIVFNGLIKGRHYEEGREFWSFDIHLEYHFITRCYNPKIEMFLNKMKSGKMKKPDVIIMNSCVWDISRWGPNGVDMYKTNMRKLMNLLDKCLPENTLFIWTTALPVSMEIKSGLLIKQLNFMQSLLRFEVMEANLFCRHLVLSHGYDILDTHYHLRMQVHRRLQDGIHYGPLPVRFITNLILTHISLSLDVPLPGNFTGVTVDKVVRNCVRYPTIAGGNVHVPPTTQLVNSHYNDEGRNESPMTPMEKAESTNHTYYQGGRPPQLQVWQNGNNVIPTNIPYDETANIPSYPYTSTQSSSHDYHWCEQVYCWPQATGQTNYTNLDHVSASGPIRKTNKFKTSVEQKPY